MSNSIFREPIQTAEIYHTDFKSFSQNPKGDNASKEFDEEIDFILSLSSTSSKPIRLNQNENGFDLNTFNNLFSKQNDSNFCDMSNIEKNQQMAPKVFELQYHALMSEITNEYNHKLLQKDNSTHEYSKQLMSDDTLNQLQIAFNQMRRISSQKSVKRLKIH